MQVEVKHVVDTHCLPKSYIATIAKKKKKKKSGALLALLAAFIILCCFQLY